MAISIKASEIEQSIKAGKAWLVRPGTGGVDWSRQHGEKIIAISYENIDLNQFFDKNGKYLDSKSKENFRKAIDKEIPADTIFEKGAAGRKTAISEHLINYHSFVKIQKGDLIFAKGPKKILGIGRVTSDYIYDGNQSEYYHTYKVDWSDHEEIPAPSPPPPKLDGPSASAITTRFTITPMPEIDIPWLTGQPPTPLREPKHWLFIVDEANWQTVEELNIWDSKANLDTLNKKIKQGDEAIFYVTGRNSSPKSMIAKNFVASFEITSKWVDKTGTPRPWPRNSMKDKTNPHFSKSHCITLKPLANGRVPLDALEKTSVYKKELSRINREKSSKKEKERKISGIKGRLTQQTAMIAGNNATPLPKADYDLIVNQMKDDIPTISKIPQPVNISRKQLAKKTFVSEKVIRDIEELLDDDDEPNQIIFHGPPGTGKTWFAKEFAYYYTKDKSNVRIIQFHPSYNYEDFVEGIRPIIKDEGDKDDKTVEGFTVKPGILKLLSDECECNPNSKFVLIIDEINRGNISRILGELIYLLEYRDEEIRLTYSPDEGFKLPRNLYIIGTMNTADRSIGMVDYALRRRFTWFEFLADPEILEKFLTSKKGKVTKSRAKRVRELMEKVNEIIADSEMGKDCEMGQSYFMKEKIDKTKMDNIFKRKISPLLNEYYINDLDKIDEIKKLFDDFS